MAWKHQVCHRYFLIKISSRSEASGEGRKSERERAAWKLNKRRENDEGRRINKVWRDRIGGKCKIMEQSAKLHVCS